MAKSEVWSKAGKTRNLSEKQVKQGQRAVGGGRTERLKKGEGAAAMKEVNIGETKWMSKGERGGKGRGGLLVDASGKAITGTVTLPSGAKASYVRGKRVTTAPKAAAPSRMSRGGGGGGGNNKPAAPLRPRGTSEFAGGGSGPLNTPAVSRRVSPSQRNEGIGGGRTTRVSPSKRGEGLVMFPSLSKEIYGRTVTRTPMKPRTKADAAKMKRIQELVRRNYQTLKPR